MLCLIQPRGGFPGTWFSASCVGGQRRPPRSGAGCVRRDAGGWRRQQSARFLKASTITPRLRLVRRMERFTGLYPWQWSPADGEAFIDDMRGGQSPIVASTARTYEVTISLFLEYLLDSCYGWAQVCEERFGDTPQQVFRSRCSVRATGCWAGSESGLALLAAFLHYPPDEVRLPGLVRAGTSGPRLRIDHRDLHGSVQ